METSFRIPEILGILQIKPGFRDLSASDRLARARECVDFAKSWKVLCNSSQMHRASATLLRNGASCQRPTASPAPKSQLVESMVSLDHLNILVDSYSTFVGEEAVLAVNDTGVTLKLIKSQNEVLTRHLVTWLAVLWLSPENELVYIGREKQSGLRIAVVLQMLTQEDGLQVIKISESRVKQKPVHKQTETLVPADPFYVNIGFASEDQERLYERFTEASSIDAHKNTDYDTFQEHLIHFIQNEIKYCTILTNLIRLRNGLKDAQLNHELRRWDIILRVHEDMNLKKFVSTRNLTARSVSETLLENRENLECYIDYIRETPSIENGSLQRFKDYKELRENVISTRKRIFHYFSNLESWLQFTTNTQEEESIKKAVMMLKAIYKTADSLLIVDSVKKCPFNLNLYLPLLKHGMFTVVGKNFKKDEVYKLLLFGDLLVFTESSYVSLNCFEALRMEQVVLMSNKEGDGRKHVIKLEVDHGERRGKEIIRVVGRMEGPVKQWEEDIVNILTQLAQRIKQQYCSGRKNSTSSAKST